MSVFKSGSTEERNQENCAIRQVTRSCILDLHTHGCRKSVVNVLCLILLMIYTDSPHQKNTSKQLKNRDRFDMFLFACF